MRVFFAIVALCLARTTLAQDLEWVPGFDAETKTLGLERHTFEPLTKEQLQEFRDALAERLRKLATP